MFCFVSIVCYSFEILPRVNFKHAIIIIFSEVTYNSKPALKSCVEVYHYMNTSGLTVEKLEAAVKSSTSAGSSADQLVFGMYKSFIISESGIDARGMFYARKQFFVIMKYHISFIKSPS